MGRNAKKITWLGVWALVLIFYYYFNPAEEEFFLPCVFRSVTGLYCVGCGGQRAFHALLHGDFVGAFQYNLLIFVVVPFAILWFTEYFFERKLIPDFIYKSGVMIFFGFFLLLFLILRNVA